MSIDVAAELQRLVDEEGARQYADGTASRQAEVDGLRGVIDDLNAVNANVRAELSALQRAYDDYRATHPDVPPDPEPEPEPPAPARTTVIGMSAPANLWDQRLRDVGGAGIKARRIFGDLTADGRSQSGLIEAAVRAGMTPVVSYKGTPTAANVKAVRDYLASLGVEVYATWHHEPHGDMTPAAFRDGSKVFLGARSDGVKVGPILNGWLLDRRRTDFVSYTSPELMAAWDFFGFDTYQSDAQSTTYPGHRIPALLEVLASAGRADMPVVVGEYNGWTAEAIAESGSIFLDCPNVVIACMWNSGPTGLGTPLEGERLAAFQRTLRDPRVKR